jgi:hypothetical protein
MYEVQMIAGHKDPKMTQVYAHLQPGHLADTAGTIDACVVDTYRTPEGAEAPQASLTHAG